MAWNVLGADFPSLVHVDDNSSTLSVDDGGGSLTVDGNVGVSGTYVEYTGSASANSTDIVAAVDVRAYKSWSLQLTGTFSLTVQVQGSNDGSNWFYLPNYQTAGTTTLTLGSSITAAGIYTGPVTTRYIRVRTTAYTSGTVTGTLELSANPSPLMSSYISGSTSISNNPMVYTNPQYDAASVGDAYGGLYLGAQAGYLYNGTNWNRVRTATAASNTTGTGLLGVAEMYFDGTNYQRVSTSAPLPVVYRGGSTASAPAAVSIGTTSGTVLAANASRRSMVIQNNHATNNLYLGFGSAPTTANGIKVAAGQSYSDEGFTGTVYGIADAASTDVRVVEFS